MPLNMQTDRTAALIAGWCCALLGLLVLLGWHWHLPAVIQIHPSFAPMQYNTALGFLLGGSGLLCARSGRLQWALVCGAAIALLGFLTLLTHISSSDLGLDQLFMQHYITVATSRPGRMAPNTALCFLLCGCALMLAGWPRALRLRQPALCLLAALVVGLSMAALMGYAVGMPTAYGWGNLTRMALHTALGFIVLGLGLIGLGAKTSGAGPDWQPWAIGVVVSTIAVTLWQALLQDSAGIVRASEFVLGFGLLMALALALAVAYSLALHRAAAATSVALAQLNQEVQERKKAEQQVRQLAFYDMLTRLPNRLLLSERLQQSRAASKRHGHFGAVMFLDLDNFKPLNDTYGHALGDLLLVEAARRLLDCVRETDTAARFGGDEFVVVLGALSGSRAESAARALQVAEKIQAALSAPYQLASGLGAVEHRCTVSIGIAMFDAQAPSPELLLTWADAAMYQAKDAGRNAIRMRQPD